MPCSDLPVISLPQQLRHWKRQRKEKRFREISEDPRKRAFWQDYRQWKKEELLREWRWMNYYRKDWEFMVVAANKVMTYTWPFIIIPWLPPRLPFFVPFGLVALFRARRWWHVFVDPAAWGCAIGMWSVWPARFMPLW